ncbi:MAG: MBL fold metallo-hydrolase [Candidatus Yanofskybacteria bacterium]|nr:MBL fold metallo-hydrolase [Candidatus Yanofskybacteria bacterium]
MKITFYGGARTVTGANYLLEHGHTKILVDCGLNQGTRYAEELNYGQFKYNPAEIKYVFITHSHIDHIGRLPKLYKDGFRGKVYTTTATRDLMAVALPDNLNKILDEAKEMGHEPLFIQEDLDGLMSLVEGVFYDEPIELEGITAIFHDAGHILGSAIVEIQWRTNYQLPITNYQAREENLSGTRKIFFSGDLGNPPTPLLRPTEKIKNADYIVIESAYGDRVHEGRKERRSKLISVIEDTIKRSGVLMIPSFAVERTQELLHELNGLFNENKIPRVPVFVDSPLANKMTAVYQKHREYFNKETAYLIGSGDDVFNFPGLKLTTAVEESKAINNVPAPKIIIAGSGMSQGGRILHHEMRYLPDTNSTILFVGYQVDGSLGRRIQRGEKEVRIMGQTVPVKCHIENLSAYSAHADQLSLIKWVGGSTVQGGGAGNLKKVFVVQGEDESARTLANLIHEKYGIEAVAPVEGESFEL